MDSDQVVPIRDAAVLDLQHPPLVSVDASDRPDIADVLRVIQSEGDGYAVTEWQPSKSGRYIRFRVAIERPVICNFDIVFDADLEPHCDVLRAATKVSAVAITTNPFERGTVFVPFNVHCDSEHIAEILNELGIEVDR